MKRTRAGLWAIGLTLLLWRQTGIAALKPSAPPASAPAPVPAATPANLDAFMSLVRQGDALLEKWEYPAAANVAKQLKEMAAQPAADKTEKREARLFQARLDFYEGDYAGARDELKAADAILALDEDGKDFLARNELLAATWAKAAEVKSDHFILRRLPGKDEILDQPALETLEKAYEVLTRDLGVKPGAPVLVEVYPAFAPFSASTGLTEDQLHNSGTIAVCKYRRLMINSPRILVRGYSYRDTLSHEFVHFLIYQQYGRAIPIWLHEGLAFYEEGRWRGAKGGEMSPGQKSVLASALKQNELITFDRMSPSLALLKTPRQTQLAFSEVNTVISYLLAQGGWKLVFRLCEELTRNPDSPSAIAKVTGKPFARFWADWIAYARGLGFKEIPGLEITALEIKKGAAKDESGEEDEDVSADQMDRGEEWNYVRLGDLLRNRNHLAAALVEYEKAQAVNPDSPVILNKLGRAYAMNGEYEKALAPFQKAVEMYPDFSTTYFFLGQSLYALKRYPEAIDTFNKGIDINPFNPIGYKFLMHIYRDQNNNELANKNKKILLTLGFPLLAQE